jgi:hypothetical protein
MSANHRHEDTYEFRRPPAPLEYLIVLVNTALVGGLIVYGPLWAKILFGYYLLGVLLTLRRRYASLASDDLLVRFQTVMRIPYSHIDAVNALPLKGFRRALAWLATGAGKRDADIEVTLNRRRWMFLPFPFPIVVPTRRLLLPLRDGSSFVQNLTRHLAGADPRGMRQTPSA